MRVQIGVESLSRLRGIRNKFEMANMSFRSKFLSILGLVLAEDYHAAEAQISALSHSLRNAQQSIADLTQQIQQAKNAGSASEIKHAELQGDVKRMLARQNWCSPHLAEFPVGTPVKLQQNTLGSLQALLGSEASFSDLTNPDKFSSPEQWVLYWCLAHACRAARSATAAKIENGISKVFLDALEAEAKAASSLLKGGHLQIAYNAIFEQSEPAMKEAAVGADILLIIAGSSLVPNGLARIFWIQAKKTATGASPFTLYYDQQNTKGLQVEALSKVDVPKRGSFGLYMQYSNKLSYIPSVHVNDLSWAGEKLDADLAAIGVRLPEFLVACTCNFSDVGAFENTDELRAYLNEVSDMKPLYIVTATAGGREYHRELAGNRLLSEISDYYQKKLGIKRTPQREKERGR